MSLFTEDNMYDVFVDGQHFRLTLTWKQYACFKKPKGCCAQNCDGCCYVPKRTVPNNTVVDPAILEQVAMIKPSFSPSLHFKEKLDPTLQRNICDELRNKRGTKELWNAFYGENVH